MQSPVLTIFLGVSRDLGSDPSGSAVPGDSRISDLLRSRRRAHKALKNNLGKGIRSTNHERFAVVSDSRAVENDARSRTYCAPRSPSRMTISYTARERLHARSYALPL